MSAVTAEPGVVLSAQMSAALEYLCWGGGRSPFAPLVRYAAEQTGVTVAEAGPAIFTLIDLGYVRVTVAGALDPLYHLTQSGRDLACHPTDETEDPTMTDIIEVIENSIEAAVAADDLGAAKPDPKPTKAPAKKKASPKTQAAAVVAAKDEAAEAAEAATTEAPPVEDVTGAENTAAPEPVAARGGKPLADDVEAKVAAAVQSVYAADAKNYVAALRWGRKVAKAKMGLRGTFPTALGVLTKDEGAAITAAVEAAV